MGKTYDAISDDLRAFIEEQQMFFVATAPLSGDAHVNLSPKGLDTFRILGPNRVAYLDLTGSGNETSAHLRENGRITIMFCAFSGPPKIVRLYGRGRTILRDDPEWIPSDLPGMRQLVLVDVERVQTSCGFGVPLYDFQQQRDALPKWAMNKGTEGLTKYRAEKNAR
ncbi:MAG: pyridoxamine 5'-phosphate oxidase family protein, partial [Thermoanaerobaculia bacterium]